MQIKHKHILVPGRRYQDSRHLLQNPKVSKNVMGFNNHTQRSTPPYYLDVDNPFKKIVLRKLYGRTQFSSTPAHLSFLDQQSSTQPKKFHSESEE